MKKILTFILSALVLCTAAACGSGGASSVSEQAAAVTEAPSTAAETVSAQTAAAGSSTASGAQVFAATDDIREKMDKLETIRFSGVAYVEKDGVPVASYVRGTLSDGTPLTLDTPMPVGSVSKQFCAAAVLLLQQQGKLNVSDTLDKYFPEFAEGTKVTLHHLLCMRSGLADFFSDSEAAQELEGKITLDNTDAQNTAVIKEWVFSHSASVEPDDVYQYNNVNYILLGNVVEQVSGKRYTDFLRESFFTPLGMDHTGSIFELKDKPAWAQAFHYDPEELQPGIEPGLAKGAGDIIATAADMTRWMNMLSSGTILSAESYKAMTTNYSGDYGYALETGIGDGAGHFGQIGDFTSVDYFDPEQRLTVFASANAGGNSTTENLLYDMLSALQK